jgi:hypothetical protein
MRVFVRPNSTISNNIPGGGEVGGDGTAHGVVSDVSMKSYLRSVHSSAGTLTRLGLGTYALTPTQRINQVRIRAIFGQTHAAGVVFALNNLVAMAYTVWAAVPFPGFSVAKPAGFKLSKWFPKNTGTNAAWTQANLDALELYLTWLDPAGNHDARVHEVDVEVHILEQPVTTNIMPAIGAITQTDTPRFVWSFFQEDNVDSPRQVGYQLKVWTKAVVEGGGFDPDASASVVNTTKTGVSNNFLDLNGSGLPQLTYGAEYYWAVKAHNTFKPTGAAWWSEWSEPTPFKVNSPPVTTVLTPTGSVTSTNQPGVTFTYSDPDGLAIQARWQAKVWKRPGASWVGFDPDTTTLEPAWQAEQISDATAFTIAQRLDNLGVYRVYVRTAHGVADNPPYIYGAWSFGEFTINLTQPATPALSVVDGDHLAGILVTPAAAGSPNVEHFEVERSLDAGVTWAPFRYAAGGLALSDAFPWNGGVPFSLQDLEPPYGVEVRYRAFSVDTTLGTKVYSQPSTVRIVTLRPQAFWLKCPAKPELNAKFPNEGSWVNLPRAVSRSIHQPIGRSLPVVVRGKAKGRHVDLSLLLQGEAQEAALMALVDAGATLYLQSPSISAYVEVRGEIPEANRPWDDRAGELRIWRANVDLVEVDEP